MFKPIITPNQIALTLAPVSANSIGAIIGTTTTAIYKTSRKKTKQQNTTKKTKTKRVSTSRLNCTVFSNN